MEESYKHLVVLLDRIIKKDHNKDPNKDTNKDYNSHVIVVGGTVENMLQIQGVSLVEIHSY